MKILNFSLSVPVFTKFPELFTTKKQCFGFYSLLVPHVFSQFSTTNLQEHIHDYGILFEALFPALRNTQNLCNFFCKYIM